MPFSVTLFIPSLVGGGGEKVIVILANAMAEKGISVDLVLGQARGEFLKNVSGKVRIVDLDASRILFALPGLVRYLRNERPAVLLSVFTHTNVISVIAKFISRVPVRVVLSEHAHFSMARQYAKTLRDRLMAFFMRWASQYAESIIAVSKGVADDLSHSLGIPRQCIAVIYNPAFTPDVLEKSNENLIHPWFASSSCPVILGVGRLSAEKNFAFLIQAFAKIRTRCDVRLIILGEGVERENLESLAQSLGVHQDVLLPGFVENPYTYMKHASLFVLPSKWEGFGNVLVEAMACGTPVIATDCPGGPSEILENGKWGYLVSVDDVDALARAIDSTLDGDVHPDVVLRAADFDVGQAVNSYIRILLPDYADKIE